MPFWRIQVDGDQVEVTYREGDRVQHCGQCDLVLRDDVEAWVFGSAADPGDIIDTVRGRFVRQATFEPPRA